jgi:hypothetical protein
VSVVLQILSPLKLELLLLASGARPAVRFLATVWLVSLVRGQFPQHVAPLP